MFTGCLKPSQEKLDSSWLKNVAGNTYISSEGVLFLVFDDSANISLKNASEDDLAGDIIIGLISAFSNFEFVCSIDKNRAIYKIDVLFFGSKYAGVKRDGNSVYFCGEIEGVANQEDIDWDAQTDDIYTLYK